MRRAVVDVKQVEMEVEQDEEMVIGEILERPDNVTQIRITFDNSWRL